MKRGKRIANACVVCSSQSRLRVAIREMPVLIDAGFLALAVSLVLYFYAEGGIFQSGIIGRVFAELRIGVVCPEIVTHEMLIGLSQKRPVSLDTGHFSRKNAII